MLSESTMSHEGQTEDEQVVSYGQVQDEETRNVPHLLVAQNYHDCQRVADKSKNKGHEVQSKYYVPQHIKFVFQLWIDVCVDLPRGISHNLSSLTHISHWIHTLRTPNPLETEVPFFAQQPSVATHKPPLSSLTPSSQ